MMLNKRTVCVPTLIIIFLHNLDHELPLEAYIFRKSQKRLTQKYTVAETASRDGAFLFVLKLGLH